MSAKTFKIYLHLFWTFLISTKLCAQYVFEEQAPQELYKIARLEKGQNLKALFWNVAWGHFNQGQRLLDQNLTTLLKHNAPDLLILAEYKSDVLSKDTLNLLSKKYSSSLFIPYDKNKIVGIKLFAKGELFIDRLKYLDWAPVNITTEEAKKFKKEWIDDYFESQYWDRNYSKISWKYNKRTIKIVPIHLLSVGNSFKRRYGSAEFLKAIFKTNNKNPISNQIANLKKQLIHDFGEDLNDDPMLLVGDFNMPSSFYAKEPADYNVLEQGLNPAFTLLKGNCGPTFPVQSELNEEEKKAIKGPFGENLQLQIDHAFTNDHLKFYNSEILKLKGSDHFPLYLTFNFNRSIFNLYDDSEPSEAEL